MKVLIWITLAAYTLAELVHGESNPYKEALLVQPWESVQKYVTVRPGAHMFYWLYYADGTIVGAENKPLIIWIQGGPGYAASGIANFAEIGPFDINMKYRNHTWVKGRNVLFIDHPVGTGFSYVANETLLVKTDQEAVIDLSETTKAFFETHKGFRKTPTYIFGQSYGGKICPMLAYYLHTEIQKKSLEMNLKGIGIGSGWVDPKESILMAPRFLHSKGLIDYKKYLSSVALAKEVSNCIDKEEYVIAKSLRDIIHIYITTEDDNIINYYNINMPPSSILDILQSNINDYVKPMLSEVVDQKLEWKWESKKVSESLITDFMMPSTKFVELLLNKTELKVAVYNGNFDAITPLAGASNWVHKLKWNESEEFKYTARIQIRGNNGFYKEKCHFSMWWIYGSGHWVPEDNPVAMEQILEYVITDK